MKQERASVVIHGCALCNNALLLTTGIIKREMAQNRILLKKNCIELLFYLFFVDFKINHNSFGHYNRDMTFSFRPIPNVNTDSHC